MFGFAPNLMDSGVQKFTPDADNGFPKIQQREIFYSVKDGDFEDPFTWQTASGRVGKSPGAFDDVYIRNTIRIVGSYAVNNMYFNGAWNQAATNRSLTINGNLINYSTFAWTPGTSAVNIYGSCISYGSIDMTGNYNLNLFGEYNYINKNKFIPGIGTIGYYRLNNQVVLDLPYYNLVVWGGGLKTLENNLVVSNAFDCRPMPIDQLSTTNLIFDIGDFDFTINGGSFIGGTLRRATSKKMLFVGGVTLQSFNPITTLDFSGNPEVEFRNGIGTAGANSFIVMNSGTGKWKFTTNNQGIYMNAGLAAYLTLDAQVEIDPGITLTQFTGRTLFNNTINGLSSTSKLTNAAVLTFATAASVPSMTTGIYDFTTSANTIEYSGNYTATIPSYFPTFHNLVISGTGTKSLGVNTTMNGALDLRGNNVIGQAGILECGNYDLSVIGRTYVGSDNGKSASLKKSGPGNVLFGGLLSTTNNGDYITFTGNPNVEMRGGMSVLSPSSYYNTGTGTWTFSTNNQTLTSYSFVFSGNVFINGAITITNGMNVSILGTLDGNNSNSKWLCNSILDLYNATTPFATLGILDYTTLPNASIGFRFNGNATLPATTFQGLRIGGTGTKTLSGNTLIQGVLDLIGNLSAPGTQGILECSTFDLQVNGATNVGSDQGKAATLSKTGSGNIIFGGVLTTSNGGDRILFPGNPTIEFKNGMNPFNASAFNFGTGLITFSTNNQTLTIYSTPTFANNILISGAIIVNTGGFVLNGILDGNNASSQLRPYAGASITYNNATQPMATGILDTFTNANTWIYGSGSQDIKGNTYRNLTLNGGGTKTLQGNVSVQNTYTLTAPATLNNNGFVLTNP